MANIKDILNREFTAYGYEKKAELGAVCVYKHKDFEDFWAICVEGFDLARQHGLYEAAVKTIATEYPYAAKNTSMLVLLNLEQKLLTTDQIVEIEKDPYFFKKYVLPYSDELTSLLTELMEKKSAKTIAELIMLPDLFNALNEENGYGMFHLLYTIAHKLPFIPIKAEQKGIQPREFLFDSLQECNAMDEVMAIEGDVQSIYDRLKTIVEKEANEQH